MTTDPDWPAPTACHSTNWAALQNLNHTLAVYDDAEDDRMVLTATSNVYGDGVETGITFGDLRRLARLAHL